MLFLSPGYLWVSGRQARYYFWLVAIFGTQGSRIKGGALAFSASFEFCLGARRSNGRNFKKGSYIRGERNDRAKGRQGRKEGKNPQRKDGEPVGPRHSARHPRVPGQVPSMLRGIARDEKPRRAALLAFRARAESLVADVREHVLQVSRVFVPVRIRVSRRSRGPVQDRPARLSGVFDGEDGRVPRRHRCPGHVHRQCLAIASGLAAAVAERKRGGGGGGGGGGGARGKRKRRRRRGPERSSIAQQAALRRLPVGLEQVLSSLPEGRGGIGRRRRDNPDLGATVAGHGGLSAAPVRRSTQASSVQMHPSDAVGGRRGAAQTEHPGRETGFAARLLDEGVPGQRARVCAAVSLSRRKLVVGGGEGAIPRGQQPSVPRRTAADRLRVRLARQRDAYRHPQTLPVPGEASPPQRRCASRGLHGQGGFRVQGLPDQAQGVQADDSGRTGALPVAVQEVPALSDARQG